MQKILVVEDDPTYLKTLGEFLKRNNFQVILSNDGQRGLETAFKEKPDLILLDIRMPVMSGLEMFTYLRRNEEYGKNAKVIILTNYDSNDKILENVTENLPVYYLVKANTPLEDLLDKIKEALSPIVTN